MRHLREADDPTSSLGSGATTAPGKRTLTSALPVQRRAAPAQATAAPARAAGDDPFGLHHAAADHGTASGGGALPFHDAIQTAFGRHDLGRVQAHVGGAATEACDAMGAQAYATGDHVAFGAAPDLHTAAHEAAHVVQQRGGVQLKGGVGEDGDVYEQHADAVADRVVRGESAEALLDQHAGSGGSAPTIQRKPSDFTKRFGDNPLLALSLLQRLTEWGTYVNEVTPYFKIPDDDVRRQLSSFYTIYSRAHSLHSAFGSKFSEQQQDLAHEINAQLDVERDELYGSSRGHMKPFFSTDDTRTPDPLPRQEHRQDSKHESVEDPGSAPLFPELPCMEHVNQGQLGDCYLLAAVASIVRLDPMHFVNHMIDHVDGTVTVRLYADVGLMFEVTVMKSLVFSSSGTRYAKGGMWVQILEKAYAASGLQRPIKRQKQKPVDDAPSYDDISGGDAADAMMHLTGKPSKSFDLGKGRERFGHEAPHILEEEQDRLRKEMYLLDDEEQMLKRTIETKRSKEDVVDVSVEEQRITAISVEVKELMRQFTTVMDPVIDLGEILKKVSVTETTLAQLAKGYQSNPSFQLLVRTAITTGVVPGELGSGRYSNDDRAAFVHIKAGIDGRRPMCASTREKISDIDNPEELSRGVSGESKVSGLAGKHAYSLLDYRPRDPQPNAPILIKLRNPWGHYGREYKAIEGKLRPVAVEGDGVFWLDLSDLTANFRAIQWGEEAPPPQQSPRFLREVELLSGRYYDDSRTDFHRALREMATDGGVGELGPELIDELERGRPFATADDLRRTVLALMPKRPDLARRIVDYLVDELHD